MWGQPVEMSPRIRRCEGRPRAKGLGKSRERGPAALPGPRGLRGEGVSSPTGKGGGGTVRQGRVEGSWPWERVLGLEGAQAIAPPRLAVGSPPGFLRPHPPAS